SRGTARTKREFSVTNFKQKENNGRACASRHERAAKTHESQERIGGGQKPFRSPAGRLRKGERLVTMSSRALRAARPRLRRTSRQSAEGTAFGSKMAKSCPPWTSSTSPML